MLIADEEGSETRNTRTALSFRGGYKPDVTEVYSPPRIVTEAEHIGLRGGDSFDLTVKREDGSPWDFAKRFQRKEAMKKTIKDEPYFVIGSPPCTRWSILEKGIKSKYTKEEWDAKLRAGKVHIDFCLAVYEFQRRGGRYFVHEHLRNAASWSLKEVMKFEKYADTIYVSSNMCQFCMVTTHKGEKGLVRKAITFMTNSAEVAARLDRRCDKKHREEFKHIAIWGARAKEAQIYPKALCQAVAAGIKAQKEIDESRLFGIELEDLSAVDSSWFSDEKFHEEASREEL